MRWTPVFVTVLGLLLATLAGCGSSDGGGLSDAVATDAPEESAPADVTASDPAPGDMDTAATDVTAEAEADVATDPAPDPATDAPAEADPVTPDVGPDPAPEVPVDVPAEVVPGCAIDDDCALPGEDPCGVRVCELPAGLCVRLPSSDGAPCDDGNGCTTDDQCAGGKCVGHPTLACGCLADEDCNPAEDGNVCNGTLSCQQGQCVVTPWSVVECNPADALPCQSLACDPATGNCVPTALPNGRPCQVDDPCNGPGFCNQGSCVTGEPWCGYVGCSSPGCSEVCDDGWDNDANGSTDCGDDGCKDVGPCRDPQCDDGTLPQCKMPTPECTVYEILAYQNHCFVCVNPKTCQPWGVPGCHTHADCPLTQRCDPCAATSCPMCLDCLSACVPSACPTDDYPLCDRIRPACAPNGVSISKGGCWLCVDVDTCQPVAEVCGDGVDNDGNGAIDCGDAACADQPACIPTEICDDGKDNDGNGYIDCEDLACKADPYCACIPEGKPLNGVPGVGCCAGLASIPCDTQGMTGGCIVCDGLPLCTACGDAKCGTGENLCNCPADCTSVSLQWSQPPSMSVNPDTGKSEYAGWHVTGGAADDVAMSPRFTQVHWWGAYQMPDGKPYPATELPLSRPSAFNFIVYDVTKCGASGMLASPLTVLWPPATYPCPAAAVWSYRTTAYAEVFTGGYTTNPGDPAYAGASVFAYAAAFPQSAWDANPVPALNRFWLNIQPLYDYTLPMNAPSWGWLTGGQYFLMTDEAVAGDVNGPWKLIPYGNPATQGVQMAFQLWGALN